jgi:phenylalanyl-tRNA synthetase beta chain
VLVPIGWLREFVDVPGDAEEIARRLAMLGFPVEEIVRRPLVTGVVVGTILEVEKHPNADRLLVARVEAGGDRPLTIVTAATNVAAGQTIAVATIGAQLPQLTIAPRKMRGIASEGMMISADELALPADWFEDGILQLDGCRASPGTDAVALLGLDAEVLDVEITSNRVDAMSIVGLARELAASYGKALRAPSLENPGAAVEPAGETPSVTIDSPDCTRFVAQRFDVSIGTAPAWMRVRLALAGQRPINNVVDVSNYVMLETGQPLHFYDASAVRDAHFVVRNGRDGERLVTLDGVERTLSPQALVVADERGALGLAGVMGGLESEVGSTTRAVLLEAANFNGARIRRTSHALALRSEASSRHEKTLAPALADAGAARAAQLLCELGATAYRPHAFGSPPGAAEPILLRAAECERLLGIAIPAQRIAEHLSALGCAVTDAGDGAFLVVPPPWRRDLGVSADLIEEVARMEGYDRIEAVVPPVEPHDISSVEYDREGDVARTLAALGYREVITLSLHGRDAIERAERSGIAFDAAYLEVLNPLSEEQRYLRASLADGLIPYFAKVNAPVRVFEIGRVFRRRDGAPTEEAMLAFGFAVEPLDEPAWRDSYFLRLKGDCETLVERVCGRRGDIGRAQAPGLHPGTSASLSIDGRTAAVFGRLDPRLARAFDVRLPVYLCFASLDALPPHATAQYRPPSKFPGTSRDIALSVGLDVSALDVERAIARALGDECTSVRVFDEYRGPQVGEGRKSIAVHVALQRFDATITDEQADEAIARALDAVGGELGAAIRT